MEILKEMGQRLSELRIQRQLKQKDMAELLDVTIDFLVRGTDRTARSTQQLISQIRELLDCFCAT